MAGREGEGERVIGLDQRHVVAVQALWSRTRQLARRASRSRHAARALLHGSVPTASARVRTAGRASSNAAGSTASVLPGENGLAAATSAPHVLDVLASGVEQTHAGAAVVLVRANSWMALVRNATRPGWAPPGGKRERSETVREGAVREVVEETGLVLDPADLVPVGYERITVAPGADPRPFDTGVNHLQVFGAVLDTGGLPPLRPDFDDVLEAGWFTREDAERMAAHEPWWPLIDWWWDRADLSPRR